MIAMSMSEKHEAKPTRVNTTKSSKFRKTADFGLNSASAWNDFNLNLLGAEYVKKEYHELPEDVCQFSVKEPTDPFRQRKLLNEQANEKATERSSEAQMLCRRRN